MRYYPTEVHKYNRKKAPIPLTAQQRAQFVARGFVPLRSSLPPAYHKLIFTRFNELVGEIGHFGNNLLPLVPELNELFEDPVVRGALTSVLGAQYAMHPHRALHSNPPGSGEQQFHKDSYWGYVRRVRNHRPWWVMIMYFPQSTPTTKGPTAVMSGSQYLNQRPEGYCNQVAIRGAAGSLVLIHYDIWHRKMLNQTDLNRYMFKFEFMRLAPPRHTDANRAMHLNANAARTNLAPLWSSVWNWLHGQRGAANGTNGATADALASDRECDGLNAAYNLSAAGRGAHRTLLAALDSNPRGYNEARRYSDDGSLWREDACVRNAAHGLVDVGAPAIPGLLDVLGSGTVRGRKHAAFALGEIGSRRAIPGLTAALDHDEVHVRVAAIEALGLVAPSQQSIEAMVNAMHDQESEVRFDAALSLMRASARTGSRLMTCAVDVLAAALYDTNRYVSAYAADTLERIGTRQALAELLPFLRTSRWCAHTDNRHPF